MLISIGSTCLILVLGKFHYGFPMPMVDMLWSIYHYLEVKLWSSYYVSRMLIFLQLIEVCTTYVVLVG